MRTEILKITPDKARKYLERNRTNRPLNKRTVSQYAAQMTKNLWLLSGEGIAIDSDNNLINGQHRLEAIKLSGKTVKMLVVFDVDPETFKVYDTGKVRSAGDIFSIAGVNNGTAVSAGMMKYLLLQKKRVNTAGRVGVRDVKLSKSELLDIYYRNPTQWDIAVIIALKYYSKNRLFPPSIVIGLIAYLIIDKKHPLIKVESFFNETYDMEPVTNKTITVMKNIIIQAALSGRPLDIASKFKYLVKAWNIYLSGEQYDKISLPKKDEILEAH